MQPTTERADARANRQRVLEAAHAVFRERGLEAEMKEIAERAGLGVGTIYRNFPTKADLIAAITSEMIGTIDAMIAAALAEPDAVEGIRALLRGGFAVVERYGGMAEMLLQGEMPRACAQQFEQLGGLERVAGLIERGMADGRLRADLQPMVTAAALISTFVPWHYGVLRGSLDHDTIVAHTTDLFLAALRPVTGER